MKRLITFTIFSLIITLRMLASSSTVYMNVDDTRTLSFSAPSYLVSTQWTISDTKAVQFTSSPGSLSTSVTIKALEPRSASQRCIVHCKYYYREFDPVSGKYIYQRSGYESWEVIITGSSQENTTVSFGIPSLNVSEGRLVDISAYPSNNSYSGKYSWSSSNNNIMTVQDPVGNRISVKGVSPGTAYLRVTIDNGNYAELPVTVTALGGGSSCLSYTLIDGGTHYSVKRDTNKTCSGSITIPASYNAKPVTAIAEDGFKFCDGMTSITIPNSVISIGNRAFYKCTGLTSVTIPYSVTSINTSAFSDCSGLTSVLIPNSVTSICDNAFDSCSGLTSLTIPNSVTSIGFRAFSGCSGLTSVTIPNSVTSIGDYAFSDCSGLTSVTIPSSVTSIGNGPFSRCNKLVKISVDSGNKNYTDKDGVLHNKELTTLIQCPGAKIYVTIPTSVTSIGRSAFSGCSGLTSLTIPNSVTSIGRNAFDRCSGLTSITIPNSVTSIGFYTFSGCSGLTSVTIPNSVTSLGNLAFSGCRGLQSVYYAAENPIEGWSNIFDNETYKAATLYIPEKAIAKAATITPWSLFENIKAHDFSGIEEIEADINPELPCEIYNLKGVKMGNSTENLPAGIYILRQGAAVKKIVVK